MSFEEKYFSHYILLTGQISLFHSFTSWNIRQYMWIICFPANDAINFEINLSFLLKVVSATILLFCFLSLKERTCQTRKNVFYSTSKGLFVLERISSSRNLDFQILWRHQMPKHKTKSIFYWITYEVNTVC